VLLEAGEANLTHRSVAIVSQICTVEKSALERRIGTLSQERVEQILTGMRFLQNIEVILLLNPSIRRFHSGAD